MRGGEGRERLVFDSGSCPARDAEAAQPFAAQHKAARLYFYLKMQKAAQETAVITQKNGSAVREVHFGYLMKHQFL
jgi:hypothetical protein